MLMVSLGVVEANTIWPVVIAPLATMPRMEVAVISQA